jgi:hypothetical protein
LNDLGRVFLGMVAVGSVVQLAFLVWVMATSSRVSRRLSGFTGRAGYHYRPALADVRRIGANLSHLRALANGQRQRLSMMREASLDLREALTDFGRALPGGRRRVISS